MLKILLCKTDWQAAGQWLSDQLAGQANKTEYICYLLDLRTISSLNTFMYMDKKMFQKHFGNKAIASGDKNIDDNNKIHEYPTNKKHIVSSVCWQKKTRAMYILSPSHTQTELPNSAESSGINQ